MFLKMSEYMSYIEANVYIEAAHTLSKNWYTIKYNSLQSCFESWYTFANTIFFKFFSREQASFIENIGSIFH